MSLFGQTASNANPAGGGSLFGQPAKPAGGPSLFGQPAKPAGAASLFGQPAAASGQPAPAPFGLAPQGAQPASSPFGQAPQGAQPAAANGLFGGAATQSKPKVNINVGAPMGGNTLFGAPAQGAGAPSLGGGISAPAPSAQTQKNNLFGPPAAGPTPGANNASASPFASASPQPGAQASQPVQFGKPAQQPPTPQVTSTQQPAPAKGGLFQPSSSAPTASGGLFQPPSSAQPAQTSSFLKPPAAKIDFSQPTPAKPIGQQPASQPIAFGQKSAETKPAQAEPIGSASGAALGFGQPLKPAGEEQKVPGVGGSSALGGAAGQPGTNPASNVTDPAQKLQTEKAAQDQAFMAKPLQYVTKKWQGQIRANENQFNNAVEGLREYELTLIKSLAEIEKVELQSGQIKETYKENMQELQDVSLQQNALLGELTSIEDELDNMLPQFLGQGNNVTKGSKDNQFLRQVMRNPEMYETSSNREQVFQKALDLEGNITQLDQSLRVVNDQMVQSEKQHAKAADLYLMTGSDNSKKQQVNDMEKALENFYSSLKWIENASVDLNFQVEDIENKVNTRQAVSNSLYTR